MEKQTTKKAQSFTEVSLLLSVVVMALVGMQVYAKRGVQARCKSAVDVVTEMVSSIAGREDNPLSQYEPYYQEDASKFSIKQINKESLSTEQSRRSITQKQYFYQESKLSSKQGVDFDADNIWE